MSKKNSLFREKALERIKSPEQLDQYLKVTRPRVWVSLFAVLLFFIGLTLWAVTGHIDTTIGTDVTVKDKKAVITTKENENYLRKSEVSKLGEGTKVIILGREVTVTSCEEKEDGTKVMYADTEFLPDGKYPGEIVIESVNAIHFLID